MDLAVIALTFAAIFVVELPDKTFLATLVLATKYRPLLVWIGVGLAFTVQTLVAVLLGHAVSFLPEDARPRGRRADVPGRGGAALPRGPQPPPGRARTRRRSPRRPRTCTGCEGRADLLPRSCSPPSGATCRSC